MSFAGTSALSSAPSSTASSASYGETSDNTSALQRDNSTCRLLRKVTLRSTSGSQSTLPSSHSQGPTAPSPIAPATSSPDSLRDTPRLRDLSLSLQSFSFSPRVSGIPSTASTPLTSSSVLPPTPAPVVENASSTSFFDHASLPTPPLSVQSVSSDAGSDCSCAPDQTSSSSSSPSLQAFPPSASPSSSFLSSSAPTSTGAPPLATLPSCSSMPLPTCTFGSTTNPFDDPELTGRLPSTNSLPNMTSYSNLNCLGRGSVSSIPFISSTASCISLSSLSAPSTRRSSNSTSMADLESAVPSLCAQEVAKLIGTQSPEVLIFDVRPFDQFSRQHLKGAINLCLPSTLLRRPAFTVSKIVDSLPPASHSQALDNWKSMSDIVVYDSGSVSLNGCSPVYLVARKFLDDDTYHGRVHYLKGGFCDFSMGFRSFVVQGSSTASSSDAEAKKSISNSTTISASCPILSGLRMPNFKSNKKSTPFFGNIRQYTDLVGGVGDPIPVRVPDSCTPHKQSLLPSWLLEAISTREGAKSIAERFYEIEKAEKGRLEGAFQTSCSFSSLKASVAAVQAIATGGATVLRNQRQGSVSNEDYKEPEKYSMCAALERGTKNRYNNIFPYDHARVKLMGKLPGQCDYINASFVSAHGSKKRYIATQGPLPETFCDFWSVVWDQGVCVIVMLTPTTEGGQVKCHQYWKDASYGPLTLTLVSEESVELSAKTHANVRVRKFRLNNKDVDAEREIVHIQYVSWPDLGEPADPIDLVSLSELSTKYNVEHECDSNDEDLQNPVVVHCSAGCGRTGTFCTVDSVIDIMSRQQAEKSDSAESAEDLVARVVHELRTQRLSMVQCLRQFVICYESILEWKLRRIEESQKAGSNRERTTLPTTETCMNKATTGIAVRAGY
ncbi:protein-tyrosine phosphatase-like protein [Lipomyces oligophaga]|uniref:protein-tyrosine phosphatase-like protein n=1 Tax=Lipomyces oligophaga TaxID=45792 RepID=UPI0034CF381E